MLPYKFLEKNPYAVYLYGSRVYGTDNSRSDHDYLVIEDSPSSEGLTIGKVDVKILSKRKFQDLLNEHRISALECLWLDDSAVIVEPDLNWDFNLNLSKLRSSISKKSSHSWVKAKKKFLEPYDHMEDELRRGKKSLFHSLRIMMFGIQIAKYGKIENYGEANNIYKKIISSELETWEAFHEEWKPLYNELCSEFRRLAPKG